MVDQLARPKDQVEFYWFSEQPQGYVNDSQLEQFDSGRLGFPNRFFDPDKAHVLYNEYHDQYALADEVGFDGIMTNEHHAAYWCGKPAVNLDAAVIAKVTKQAKIAILGNVIAVNDPIRMAEEIAMLDCYSGGRIISGFVRGGAVETLQAGIDPHGKPGTVRRGPRSDSEMLDRARPLPLRGKVLPVPGGESLGAAHAEGPVPDIWFPGTGSPESVVWAAKNGHPYMNLGAVMETTEWLKNIYIDTALEAGFRPGPEHFGYLLKVFVADSDEKADEIGRNFVWTEGHRQRGPREHVDPPGYQSRQALQIKRSRPTGVFAGNAGHPESYDLQKNHRTIIVGTPDTVIEQLTWVVEKLNPGYLLIYGNEGPMPHEDCMRSIDLLGKEVIPALKEIQLQPYEAN